MVYGIPLFYFVLFLSFIVGLARYKSIEINYFKLSVLYLFMNLLVETYGIISKDQGKNNFWVYNLSTTAEFGFYYYLFYKATGNLLHKKIIKAISMVFLPLCFINIFFIQGINVFHNNTFGLGSVTMVYLAACYFKQELGLEEIANPLSKKMFWIATGVLFFYTGTVFYLGLFEFIHIKNAALVNNFDILLNILNICLYVVYIISFLFVNGK
ncbi:MAG: hypothetical protein ABJC98_00560 [Bacteroidota bacterium]